MLGEKAREPPKDDNDAGLFFAPTSKKKTAGEVAFTRCDPDVERCIKERQESGRRPRFDDGPEDAAYLHPCCLCFDATALDHRYVVYREIVRTAKVYVRDATTVAPLALILFGGRLTVHHERGIISVDEKVHFRAPPKVATLASILRSELEALLLRKIVTPDAHVDERERAFVDASRGMLDGLRAKLSNAPLPFKTEVVEADAARLPLSTGAYDCVVDTFGLCVYDEPVAVLRELGRVVKPAGRILLLENARPSNALLGAYLCGNISYESTSRRWRGAREI